MCRVHGHEGLERHVNHWDAFLIAVNLAIPDLLVDCWVEDQWFKVFWLCDLGLEPRLSPERARAGHLCQHLVVTALTHGFEHVQARLGLRSLRQSLNFVLNRMGLEARDSIRKSLRRVEVVLQHLETLLDLRVLTKQRETLLDLIGSCKG